METAAQLISQRVVEANPTDRLADVAAKLQGFRSSHCAVVDADGSKFIGVVRLGDVARWSDPANRILADLVSKVPPMRVGEQEPAVDVARLFERHDLGEAVVFSSDGSYLGLITAESVLKWSLERIRGAEAEREQGAAALREMGSRLSAGSRAKSAFLAALSHELRNPLNPILLIASDRANNPALDEQLRQDFRTIARSAAAEAKLVEELLDLTNVLSGEVTMDLQPVRLHGLLDEALEAVGPMLTGKMISLEKRWFAPDDSVHADSRRVLQIVAHILGAAVNATPANGGILVETAAADRTSGVIITFRDTGNGMTPEELERLFVPFSPLDSLDGGSIYRPRSLGLGMVLAKGLIEQHGGTIDVTSRGKGQGSTVQVMLPRSPARPAAQVVGVAERS